jgi:leucyl-tRNA synthetase
MIQLRNQGIILGEDSEKMSKSRGNVVAPDALVARYGADTVRAYLMFFARWDMGAPWNSSGIEGAARWLRRVWLYLRMMAPVTPHIAEELWARLGKPYSVHNQPWPEVDEQAAAEEQVTLVIQVNGKVRDRINVPVDIDDEDARSAALASVAVQRILAGKPPRKVIVVPGKLVNIVQ